MSRTGIAVVEWWVIECECLGEVSEREQGKDDTRCGGGEGRHAVGVGVGVGVDDDGCCDAEDWAERACMYYKERGVVSGDAAGEEDVESMREAVRRCLTVVRLSKGKE